MERPFAVANPDKVHAMLKPGEERNTEPRGSLLEQSRFLRAGPVFKTDLWLVENLSESVLGAAGSQGGSQL